MEKIRGYVDHIIFRNKENGYTVLNLICEGEDLTCVGIFPDVEEGESILAQGEYTVHPSYGSQFKVITYETTVYEDEVSVERYLASGAIKGIGASLASKIVKKFGEDTFRIMEDEPELLIQIKGISERKAQDIATQVAEKHDMRKAMIYLQQYGISIALGVKIYNEYRQEMYEMLRTNPYRMADDVAGVGFRTADEIAQKVGILADADFRIRSGILYTLQQAAQQGHTCLPAEDVTKETAQMLSLSEEAIEHQYTYLAIEKKLVIQERDGRVFLYAAVYYHMEANVAHSLHQLNARYDVPDIEIEQRIHKVSKQSGLEADELQELAVKSAIQNGLLVITGGPGTGKTTIINMIIQYFAQVGSDILLAAPTGRAAKRMSEATGYEARTIHRMLELSGDVEGTAGFERNAQNPLEADVIIIDEMSMVDLSLMNALLQAIPFGTRLILVGDTHQLPSVGAGSVLKDVIESEVCKTVCLNRIFRQAFESDIVVNAHRILDGEEVSLDNDSKDFFFLKRYQADKIINVCVTLIRDKLPQYVDANPIDIQLLTPMRKGALGVERLNTALQYYLNSPEAGKAEKQMGNFVFREGDKVMQIKNNYQLEWVIVSKYGIPIDQGVGIFNGDVGIIRSIDSYMEVVTVEFDEGRRVEYEFNQLDELELAYAITIHKSQGSEYPAVVIPLLSGPAMLMTRNLLYTALTRAKSCAVLVGDERTFAQMVQNQREQARYSGLMQRLQEELSL